MDALPHQQDRLILRALAPRVEIILTAELRRADGPHQRQLLQALENFLAPRQRIEDATRVSQFLVHKLLGLRAARILQPAIVVHDLVTVQVVGDRLDLGLRRSERRRTRRRRPVLRHRHSR